MASELSLTTCSTSSTSVLVTDRIASMSLISARPMMSSVADMSFTFRGLLRREGRDDELAHEAQGGIGVAEVDSAGGSEEVGEHHAGQPLGQLGRAPGA